ncbi:sugar transferase [Candidatus Uhrbacteria bacterium]|nr:sugar transferase [Candidatus Uhrbacteria bacterium]
MSYPRAKRALDIFGALLGLVAIAPLAPLIILAIRLETPGPGVVKLPRMSGGRVVAVYKFRSMVDRARERKAGLAHLNERTDGPFFKIANDPRLTRVGRIIRRFRLDEFPQLWNVLRGDLALVGPRPHEEDEVRRYPDGYAHIAMARAGVTGLSQVSGASSLPFLKELELDSYYLEHQSLWLDFTILARTAAILFFDPTAV